MLLNILLLQGVKGKMKRDNKDFPGGPVVNSPPCNAGGFPGSLDSKESACGEGDPGSVPELGRSPGEGHGNPLQYSCLKNSMDRGACQATVHKVAESDRTEPLALSLSLAMQGSGNEDLSCCGEPKPVHPSPCTPTREKPVCLEKPTHCN